MPVLQVGCDPGYCGAFALLSEEGNLIDVKDMPILEEKMPGKLTFTEEGDVKRKVKTVRSLNEQQVYNLLLGWRLLENAQQFCIEDVSAMPDDGVASAFKFGHNTGIVAGVAIGAGYVVRRVRANIWKRRMNCTADKESSRMQAQILFSEHSLFKRVKDDGRAEAALIARYAQLVSA